MSIPKYPIFYYKNYYFISSDVYSCYLPTVRTLRQFLTNVCSRPLMSFSNINKYSKWLTIQNGDTEKIQTIYQVKF